MFFSLIDPIVPEYFYDRADAIPTIARVGIVATASSFVYAVVLIAFAAAMWYYQLSAQHVTDVIVGSRTSISGYDCKPVAADSYYRLGYTVAECPAYVREVTFDNFVFENSKYYFHPFGGSQYKELLWPKEPNARKAELDTLSCTAASGGHTLDPERSDYTSDDKGIYVEAGSATVASSAADKQLVVDCFNKIINFVYADVDGDGVGDVCDFAASNLPYTCEKTEQMPWVQIISLANGNAALLFTILIGVVSYILRDKRKFDHWVKKLPLWTEFYDEPKEIKFISSDATIAFVAICIAVLTLGTFAGFFAMYSQSEYNLKETIITSEWEKSGYTCTPLTQDDMGYGLTWDYATCLANVQAPSTSTIDFTSQTNTGPVGTGATNTYTRFDAKWQPFKAYTTEGVESKMWENYTKPALATTYGYDSWGIENWATGGQEYGTRSLVNSAGQSARISYFEVTAGATFSWTDANKANAVEVWKLLADDLGDNVCLWAKENAPYECVKDETLDVMTRASLSFTFAQLVFVVLSFTAALVIKSSRSKRRTPAPARTLPEKPPPPPEKTYQGRVPLPEKMYVEQVMDLIAPPSFILGMFFVIVVALEVVFAVMMWYYLTFTWTEVVIESTNYQKSGYTCRPAQREISWYEQDWTYEECVAKLQVPTTANTGLDDFTVLPASWTSSAAAASITPDGPENYNNAGKYESNNAYAVRSPCTGPRTTALARCTPFLRDFCLRAFLSARRPSVSIPTRLDAFQLHLTPP
jgi:hypothetical protein